MKKIIKGILAALSIIFAVIIVMVGQRNVGYPGLAVMLLGITVILVLLYFYNKSQK